MTQSSIFPGGASLQAQADAAKRSCEEFPETFPLIQMAVRFLVQIILPPSKRWAFISTGKNASTSFLSYAFEAEFGCKLGVKLDPLVDINPKAVVHEVANSFAFSRAYIQGMSARDVLSVEGMQRICIVRNPYNRALSAFTYFCSSQELRKGWFLHDRIRANATVQFDWEKHPNTVEGFVRFLRYIELEIARVGASGLDGHWMPQVEFIQPTVFNPTLVGRLEDMDTFYRSFRTAIGVDDLMSMASVENAQVRDAESYLTSKEVRGLIEDIYKADFEYWGYSL